MKSTIKKNVLQQFAEKIQGSFEPRNYEGGLEFRAIGGLDQLRQEAEKLIKENNWPLQIFKVDIRVRSISVRQLDEP